MSTTKNIDFFNSVVNAVLEDLYANFPLPKHLVVEELVGKALPKDSTDELTWNSVQMAGCVIRVLADLGLITTGGPYSDGSKYMNAQITFAGLSLLGRVPSSLVPRKIKYLDTPPERASLVRRLPRGGVSFLASRVKTKLGRDDGR